MYTTFHCQCFGQSWYHGSLFQSVHGASRCLFTILYASLTTAPLPSRQQSLDCKPGVRLSPDESRKLQVTIILRFIHVDPAAMYPNLLPCRALCHHGMTIDSVGGISLAVTDSDWWWWLRASFPPPQTNSSTRGLRLWQCPVFCALYLRWLKMVT